MEHLEPFLSGISLCLNVFSVAILLWGVAIAIKDFLFSRFVQESPVAGMRRLTHIKNAMGAYVLLSLEILIAADIVESIARPTVEDILKLATVVAIRTVISFFLNKEIRDSELQEKEDADTAEAEAEAGAELRRRSGKNA